MNKTIRIIQHLIAAFIAVVAAFALVGTTILITGLRGDNYYNVYDSDRTKAYEDSYLFNNILGNNVADIIRHVAIRSQLETDGVYDEDKIIDVTAYVNRGAVLPGDYITARYYLKDLLKWAQGGFSYETKEFTEEEAQSFLSHSTTYVHLKNNILSGGMNSYLNSQLNDNTIAFSVSGNSVPNGGSHTILLSRYQTIDEKNIEDIVSTWEEYDLLCSYIVEAAKDLLSNYSEYDTANEYFAYENSNLRYYITRTINARTEVYTNVSELKSGSNGIDIDELFEGYGKFIYYCPYELDYETNTLIKENVIRSLIKSYSYAYPDQMKIYVAADTNNYPASDSFTQGKSSFDRYIPYRVQLYILALVAGIIYIVLAVISIRRIKVTVNLAEAGNIEEKPLSQAATPKHIYTETMLLGGLIVCALPFIIVYAVYMLSGQPSLFGLAHQPYFFVIAALCGFVFDIGLLMLVYGFADKIKGKTLWKDSIIRKIGLGTGSVITGAANNGNVVLRTWVPYVLFMVLNFLLFKLGLSGIIVAAFLDILVGIYIYRQSLDRAGIIKVIQNIKNGNVKDKVETEKLHSDNVSLAEAVNSIGEGIDVAVNTSMKDEKLKADLITNVSHDIKTPLTSIINYIDLIKREDIQNERVKEYVNVLDMKSQKLKQLTEDLVEASKISSGNISIELGKINFVELINQTLGEFYEKFEKRSLQPIFKPETQSMEIIADPRHLWRVIENLLNNVCKYALSGTRVYLDMHSEGESVVFSVKNISASELNIDSDELTERFIRGDVSRTTEGSGLGLSIAKNLTEAQGGSFDIRLDGDLFKVIIKFDKA